MISDQVRLDVIKTQLQRYTRYRLGQKELGPFKFVLRCARALRTNKVEECDAVLPMRVARRVFRREALAIIGLDGAGFEDRRETLDRRRVVDPAAKQSAQRSARIAPARL